MSSPTSPPVSPAQSVPSIEPASHLRGSTGRGSREHTYASWVKERASITDDLSIYPSVNFETLAEYLNRPYIKTPDLLRTPSEGDANTLFATLYPLPVDQTAKDQSSQELKSKELSSRNFWSREELVEVVRKINSNPELVNFLLFLRGHPTPEWLNAIGGRFNVDPEFYRRHLDLGSSPITSHLFASPSLPSVSNNFITLRVTTFGTWLYPYPLAAMKAARQDASKALKSFKTRLSDLNDEVGTSFVRRFSLHDPEYFTIEQNISLCCCKVNRPNSQFTIVAWLDSGKDLDKGPPGPWTVPGSAPEYKHVKVYRLYSVIRHLSKNTFSTYQPGRPRAPQQRAPLGFEHSRSILNQNYGSELSKATMAEDSFYAVHDLFTFKAFAEVQFLNLVESVLSSLTDITTPREEPAFDSLAFHKDLLEKHARALKENIKSIESRGGPDWPRVKRDKIKLYEIAVSAQEALLHDYQWLLQRTEDLSAVCDRGMQAINNKRMLDESRQANTQAAAVTKLTKIATLFSFVYIPLSFTTAFFGMNFKIFGQGSLGVWIWFVVSLPVLAISALGIALYLKPREDASRKWYHLRRKKVASEDDSQVA